MTNTISNIAREGAYFERILSARPDPTWRGKDDHDRIYIGEFSPQRRIHLWRFLLRNAAVYCLRVSYWQCFSPWAPNEDTHAADDFDLYQEWMAAHPVDWIVGTTFMQALAALIIGDGNAHVLEDKPDPRAVQRLAAGIEW